MTRRAVVLAVLAVVGVVGLVAGLGYDERARQDGEPGLLERALVGEATPTTSYTIAVSFDPDTGVWRAGERSWRGEPMAKTQVTTADTLTCTVRIMGVDPPQIDGAGLPMQLLWINLDQVAHIEFSACGGHWVGDTWYYDVAIGRELADPEQPYELVSFPADGELHDYSVSIHMPMTLTTVRADEPIGDKAFATHAKERVATDAWSSVAGIASVSAGPFSEQWEVGGGTVSRGITVTSEVAVWSGNGHFEGEMDLFRIDDIALNGAAIDASLLDVAGVPYWTGGSYEQDPRWKGEGSDIRCMQEDYIGTASWHMPNLAVTPPIVHSFSGLHVTDMDGADLSDLVIWFTGAQWYNANTEAWEYRGYTLAEWQALTLVPNYGLYSWDPQPPPDGALRTLATAGFYIDRDSARTHQLDGFAEPEEA